MMAIWLDTLARLGWLALPSLVGFAVAAGGWPRLEQSIDALNRYALHIAFPALVTHGLVKEGLQLPSDPMMWLLVPAAGLAYAIAARALGGRHAGTIALVALFANYAYLGLPVVAALFDAERVGLGSLWVALFVAQSVMLGPALLQAWSGSEVGRKNVLKMPLLWAPVIGLAARWLPEAGQGWVRTAIDPFAASAAPVALFMLGLYLFSERHQLSRLDGETALHVGARLLVAPALTLGVAAIASIWLDASLLQPLVVLSAMPVAITTFSIATDAGFGQQTVARAIVWSTALSPLTLPMWTVIARSTLSD